jgi:phosphoribosylformylglycinamidine cyclo-ligase
MYDPTKPNTDIVLAQMKRTWKSRWISVSDGPYPIITRTFPLQVVEIDHTDGIGTKGKLHWKFRSFRNAVLDALAMNINDLTMARAEPFKLQNHIILPKDDREAIEEIMTSMADECEARKIVITGGESSIDDEFDGVEISVTMSGWIAASQMFSNTFASGTKLVGIASSGPHSNGWTLIRKLFKGDIDPEWLAPTKIYDIPVSQSIRGIQHITGGAFTKLKSKLDKNSNIYINRNHSLIPQGVFSDIFDRTKSAVKMYTTFNCGIGMILAVDPIMLDWVISRVNGVLIGEVKPGKGDIVIESMFNKEIITL